MNIFYLDTCPGLAAQMQHDRHVVKMPLESAQMCSTALIETYPDVVEYHDVPGKKKPVPHFGGTPTYRSTHKNHPCNIWLRKSAAHFYWLINHGLALCVEYTFRFGKVHKCQDVLTQLLRIHQRYEMTGSGFEAPPNATGGYETLPIVEAYRAYYNEKKSWWKKRQGPEKRQIIVPAEFRVRGAPEWYCPGPAPALAA